MHDDFKFINLKSFDMVKYIKIIKEDNYNNNKFNKCLYIYLNKLEENPGVRN